MLVSRAAGVAAAVVALIAIALSTLASADEPEEPMTTTVVLEPGDNFVGWVGEPMAMSDLFEAYPDIEAVSTWHPYSEKHLVAAPSIPDEEWSLISFRPGQAYMIRVGGDDPIEMERSLEPAAGRVALKYGTNWVTWLGRDEWTIDRVVQGIGRSLTQVRMGDLTYSPASPEISQDWPAIKRGSALEVTVSRSVNWLQPTFVMPEIVFPGGAPEWLVKQVRGTVKGSAGLLCRRIRHSGRSVRFRDYLGQGQ